MLPFNVLKVIKHNFDAAHVSKISITVYVDNYLCAKQDTRSVEFTKVTQGDDSVHLVLWNRSSRHVVHDKFRV